LDGGSNGEHLFATVSMIRPADNPPDPDAKGVLTMEQSATKEIFDADTEALPVGMDVGFLFFIETGVGTNTFKFVDSMPIVSAAQGRYHLLLESSTGAAPPELGVAHVSDLAGRWFEVRNQAGLTFLHGKLQTMTMSLTKGNKNQKHKLHLPQIPPNVKAR